MHLSHRKSLSVILLSAGLLLATTMAGLIGTGPASAATPHMAGAMVKAAHQAQFGTILATARNKALYYWTPEKGGKVKCLGGCAKVWPPLLVPKGMMVPMHLAGVMGAFGTVMRPDGTHQLTFNHWPLYTFTSDTKPLQVLCNGVDGWYVVKLAGH